MAESVYRGTCFCGAVHIEVKGEPMLSGYCHCRDCRDWSNTPVTSFIMFPYDAVRVTQGKDDLASFGRIPETPRAWCRRCGGHVGAFRDKYDPPHVALGPEILTSFPFAPQMHVFCRDAVISVIDDLPRYRDLPATFRMPDTNVAGSGELMPDSPVP